MTHFQLDIGLQSEFEEQLASAVADAAELFPNQVRAIQGLAQLAQRRWVEYATGARALPDGRTLRAESGEYASSIKIRSEGVLKYVIFSDAPTARWIEQGTPAWDMRKLLQTSNKVRTGKDGQKYMIVPFQHRTPKALGVTMTEDIHSWWMSRDRDNSSSVVSGHYTEPSVQAGGGSVTRNTYRWGNRLSAADLKGMGLDPDGLGKRFVGMVRFQHNEDKGGSYVTFRVLSERSKDPRWLRKATRGYAPAAATLDFIQTHYQEIMRIALEEDVKRLARP
jgi:hypothetical protein